MLERVLVFETGHRADVARALRAERTNAAGFRVAAIDFLKISNRDAGQQAPTPTRPLGVAQAAVSAQDVGFWPAAQPRPAPPGRALPSAPFTRGVNFGRRSGAHCLTRNVTGQIPADEWAGVTESDRWCRWRDGSAWARGARFCR